MREQEWLGDHQPLAMLQHLQPLPISRLVPLAVACLQEVSKPIEFQEAKNLVAVAERLRDNKATRTELKRAIDAVRRRYNGYPPGGLYEMWGDALWEAIDGNAEGLNVAIELALDYPTDQPSRRTLADLLRDMVPNPFRPTPILSASLLTADILALARTIYDERAYARLPELADDLAAAGCEDPELLGHLRAAGPHAKGCWALDVVLGSG